MMLFFDAAFLCLETGGRNFFHKRMVLDAGRRGKEEKEDALKPAGIQGIRSG